MSAAFVVAACSLVAMTGVVRAQAPGASASAGLPLHRSPLPKLAPTTLPAPDPAQIAELDAALTKIISAKDDERKDGLTRLKEGGAQLLPAMSRRLAELRKGANRDVMGTLITDARKQGKKGSKGKPEPSEKPDKPEKGDKGDKDKPEKKPKHKPVEKEEKDDPASDWLNFVTASPRPTDPVYKELVTILAIERALVDIGTTPATRELVNVFVYFGDLFRIDVQHMITRLGDRAVPALLEARKHDAEKVRRWASRQLDALGRAIPGEAVQVSDPAVLAEVLRAYGRTKDIEALRPLVSFASSDRVQIRDAAREAVVSYGEAALWQLREAYETLTGQRPSPGATWDKVAQDLFAVHDRARLAEVFSLFDEGLAAMRDKKYVEMAQAFDKVLARAPTFERRGEMTGGYLAYAHEVEEKQPAQALLFARKALRLAPDAADAKSIESYVLTLEGEQEIARGVVDTVPFKRALEIEPSNERAKRDLVRAEQNLTSTAQGPQRYLLAAGIGLVGTILALFVGFWRRDRDDDAPPPQAPPKHDEGHALDAGHDRASGEASGEAPGE
jgi:tetratricopeptide (TPR) repeat protein